MNTLDCHLPPPAVAAMSPGRLFGAYVAEARSECLRYLRMPGFMLPVMLFSSVFYLFFGVIMGAGEGPRVSIWMLSNFSVFGVMAAGLFGFGVSLAMERDNGLLTLKRALPMPPGAYLIGKMVMAMLVSGLLVALLLVLAASLGHVTMSAHLVIGLLLVGMLGVLPFGALGMWLGTLVKGQGGPGVINLVYLPMAFLSGLWQPLPLLPHVIQQIAPVWPSYHLNAIALDVVGAHDVPVLGHVAVLAGFTVLFLGLAARRLRRHG